jgi:hypothetical protein
MYGLLDSAKINRLNVHILDLFRQFFTSKKHVYDFTDQEAGVNYFFDSINQGMEGYLTGYGNKIKPGVYILLSIDQNLQTYEVKELNVYASPADLWTAHLVKVNRQSVLS